MKVLHISTHDINGGAAIAATRLHLGMRKAGLDSTMLVADKTGGDPDTIALHNNFSYSLRRNLDRLPLKFERAKDSIGWQSLAWLPNKKLERAVADAQADVIHVHWAQNGFLPLQSLPRLNAPIVWTFHDMWPVCGAFHHEYENDWRNPEAYTRANRPAGRGGLDLDKWAWRRKRKIYDRIKLEAVVPSHWMADRVRGSQLWKDREVSVIANGLDATVFKPLDRAAARELLNLPKDKTIILFGAMYAGSDKNKGYDQLRGALDALDLPADSTELAVFGMSRPADGETPLPYKAHWLGVLRDQHTLAALYAAADVMVVPSLQESFGQTASEPMACGTPVVAFDTSGLKDIVDHQQNGYLARKFEPEDLAAGIRWVLADEQRYQELAKASRAKALAQFSTDAVAESYLGLYRKAMAGSSAIKTADSSQDAGELSLSASS